MLKELRGAARINKAQSLERHPKLFMLDQSLLNGPDVLAGPDLFETIAGILFPTARPMTENQLFDVEHLRLHVRTGEDVFVTLNPNDFVTRGRQGDLRRRGIWVLSPTETVALLNSLYQWARAV